jgi:hypothetical protein
MNPRQYFQLEQAVELSKAFDEEGADYLFIGKSAAILLGYPAITQDVDVFPARTPENGARIIKALRKLRFPLNDELEQSIRQGKDFVQIKTGPFDLDLVFAPDGISSFEAAKARSLMVEGFRIADLRDVIASKRASNRQKDLIDLPLLERFREEYEKLHPRPLRSASDIVAKRSRSPK